MESNHHHPLRRRMLCPLSYRRFPDARHKGGVPDHSRVTLSCYPLARNSEHFRAASRTRASGYVGLPNTNSVTHHNRPRPVKPGKSESHHTIDVLFQASPTRNSDTTNKVTAPTQRRAPQRTRATTDHARHTATEAHATSRKERTRPARATHTRGAGLLALADYRLS